jgi:hypothetical protein
MPLSQCPVCHQKPAYAGNTAYCPNCGWNRDLAISALKSNLNSTFVATVMFAGFAAFLYWGLKLNRKPELMLFPLFPALVIPINFVLAKKKLAKLQAMQQLAQPSTAGSVSGTNLNGTSADATGAFKPSPQDEALLRAPVPREVRMAKRGRIATSVAAFGLSMFLFPMVIGLYQQWTRYHSFSGVRGMGWMIGIETLVALAAYGIWRNQTRECELLKHGEVVMGRVVNQWTDDKRNTTINYEFTDFMGTSHRGGGQDLTQQLYTGMPVVVFYNRENPKRNIPACATYHEVVLPPYISQPSEPTLANR